MSGDITANPRAGDPATEPNRDQRAGLACVACGTDLRTCQDTVVTGGTPIAQLLACPGDCARDLIGSPYGLDQAPMPLAIRIGRHEGWCW